jgi:Domain of unknown function (DUF1911)
MANTFRENRRQRFLTEQFFLRQIKRRERMSAVFSEQSRDLGLEPSSRAIACDGRASELYERLSLTYTAGLPMQLLRSDIGEVIEAYVLYQHALEAAEQIPQVAPLGFENLADYERAAQLISLCYLLHRRDLLPKIRALFDAAYGGEDTVYEDLMAFDVAGRADVDKWYHAEPYSALVNAMYLAPAEAQSELKRYCDIWYKAFEGASWHNSHLRIDGAEGDYFGYWAFEAGAVALLYNLDDSAVEHMVYPRELVLWAREHRVLSEEDERGDVRLRCLANEACFRDGFWFTPARLHSRRHFKSGELMPDVGGDYGITIWQWDEQQ